MPVDCFLDENIIILLQAKKETVRKNYVFFKTNTLFAKQELFLLY